MDDDNLTIRAVNFFIDTLLKIPDDDKANRYFLKLFQELAKNSRDDVRNYFHKLEISEQLSFFLNLSAIFEINGGFVLLTPNFKISHSGNAVDYYNRNSVEPLSIEEHVVNLCVQYLKICDGIHFAQLISDVRRKHSAVGTFFYHLSLVEQYCFFKQRCNKFAVNEEGILSLQDWMKYDLEDIMKELESVLQITGPTHFTAVIDRVRETSPNLDCFFDCMAPREYYSFFKSQPQFTALGDGYVKLSHVGGYHNCSCNLEEDVLDFLECRIRDFGPCYFMKLVGSLQQGNKYIKDFFSRYTNDNIFWFFEKSLRFCIGVDGIVKLADKKEETKLPARQDSEKPLQSFLVDTLKSSGPSPYTELLTKAMQSSEMFQFVSDYSNSAKLKYFKDHSNLFEITGDGLVTLKDLTIQAEKTNTDSSLTVIKSFLIQYLNFNGRCACSTLLSLLNLTNENVQNFIVNSDGDGTADFFLQCPEFTVSSQGTISLSVDGESYSETENEDKNMDLLITVLKEHGLMHIEILFSRCQELSEDAKFYFAHLSSSGMCAFLQNHPTVFVMDADEIVSLFSLDEEAQSEESNDDYENVLSRVIESLTNSLKIYKTLHYISLIERVKISDPKIISTFFDDFDRSDIFWFFKEHTNEFVIDIKGNVSLAKGAAGSMVDDTEIARKIEEYMESQLEHSSPQHFQSLVKKLQIRSLDISHYFDSYGKNYIFRFFKERPEKFVISGYGYIVLPNQTKEGRMLKRNVIDFLKNYLKKNDNVSYLKLLEELHAAPEDISYYFNGLSDADVLKFFKDSTEFNVNVEGVVSLMPVFTDSPTAENFVQSRSQISDDGENTFVFEDRCSVKSPVVNQKLDVDSSLRQRIFSSSVDDISDTSRYRNQHLSRWSQSCKSLDWSDSAGKDMDNDIKTENEVHHVETNETHHVETNEIWIKPFGSDQIEYKVVAKLITHLKDHGQQHFQKLCNVSKDFFKGMSRLMKLTYFESRHYIFQISNDGVVDLVTKMPTEVFEQRLERTIVAVLKRNKAKKKTYTAFKPIAMNFNKSLIVELALMSHDDIYQFIINRPNLFKMEDRYVYLCDNNSTWYPRTIQGRNRVNGVCDNEKHVISIILNHLKNGNSIHHRHVARLHVDVYEFLKKFDSKELFHFFKSKPVFYVGSDGYVFASGKGFQVSNLMDLDMTETVNDDDRYSSSSNRTTNTTGLDTFLTDGKEEKLTNGTDLDFDATFSSMAFILTSAEEYEVPKNASILPPPPLDSVSKNQLDYVGRFVSKKYGHISSFHERVLKQLFSILEDKREMTLNELISTVIERDPMLVPFFEQFKSAEDIRKLVKIHSFYFAMDANNIVSLKTSKPAFDSDEGLRYLMETLEIDLVIYYSRVLQHGSVVTNKDIYNYLMSAPAYLSFHLKANQMCDEINVMKFCKSIPEIFDVIDNEHVRLKPNNSSKEFPCTRCQLARDKKKFVDVAVQCHLSRDSSNLGTDPKAVQPLPNEFLSMESQNASYDPLSISSAVPFCMDTHISPFYSQSYDDMKPSETMQELTMMVQSQTTWITDFVKQQSVANVPRTQLLSLAQSYDPELEKDSVLFMKGWLYLKTSVPLSTLTENIVYAPSYIRNYISSYSDLLVFFFRHPEDFIIDAQEHVSIRNWS